MAHSDHLKNILTSKWYGSEEKLIALSRDFGKSKIINGVQLIENPFKWKLRRKLDDDNCFKKLGMPFTSPQTIMMGLENQNAIRNNKFI